MTQQKKPATVIDYLKITEDFFLSKKIASARLDAELLLAKVLNLNRIDLYINYEMLLSQEEVSRYRELVARRGKREPVAYILGNKEFFSRDFIVNRDVLVPRPETETLVEEVLRIVETLNSPTILEVGVGSGCNIITVALEYPQAVYFGNDISSKALTVAKQNVEKHNLVDQISLSQADMCGNCKIEQFDLIFSNPPYIEEDEYNSLEPELFYEPKIALMAKDDGLSFYKRIIYEGNKFLKDDGFFLLEIGSFKQKQFLTNNFKENGWNEIYFVKDLSSFPRVAVLKK